MIVGVQFDAYKVALQFVRRDKRRTRPAEGIEDRITGAAVSLDQGFEGMRPAKYTVDCLAMGMREVFRVVSLPPRLWE